MAKIEKWICIGCQFLLGFVEDKKLVRIKRKDLYVQITGGQVMMNCCRCGKLNYLVDEPTDTIELKEDLNTKRKED